MYSVTKWIAAFRLRTLFLAASGVILGSGLAWHEGFFSKVTFWLALALAFSIQILSNLANDLGDFLKGTDITGRREGPQRTLQSGQISPKQMQRAIVVFIILSACVGIALVLNAAQNIGWPAVIIMLSVGVACILSALFYTMGKHAYGYHGLGDFFAFLFFGPVPVLGVYFLHVHTLGWQPILPAIGLGLISAMMLNVNNMRDIENDKTSGKITIAVKLGLKNAKFYHTLLTFFMFTCFLTYNFFFAPSPWYRYLYVAVFFLYLKMLASIHAKQGKALDKYLKFTALSGFVLAVAFVLYQYLI